jgi:hypothetical protein
VPEPSPGELYPVFFFGTEIQRVLAAANWVAANMTYYDDPTTPDGTNDVWTDSEQQYLEIDTNLDGTADAVGTGDCEDFSILLCTLMRFRCGVPSDRVWVQRGLVAAPIHEELPYFHIPPPAEVPPLLAHTYVVYKSERWGIWYIEPQWGTNPYLAFYRGSKQPSRPNSTSGIVLPPRKNALPLILPLMTDVLKSKSS